MDKFGAYKESLERNVRVYMDSCRKQSTDDLKVYATECQLDRYNSKKISEAVFRKLCLERIERKQLSDLKKHLDRVEKGMTITALTLDGSKLVNGRYMFKLSIYFNGGRTNKDIKKFRDIRGEDITCIFKETGIISYLQGRVLMMDNSVGKVTNYAYSSIEALKSLCEAGGLTEIIEDTLNLNIDNGVIGSFSCRVPYKRV